MSKFDRAREIYRQEGVVSLCRKSVKYATSKILRKPTVTDNSTPSALWILKYGYNSIFKLKYGFGTDVMSEDWDTLVLLDACRHDDFKQINDIPGDLQSRISKGVDSAEFIRKNFVGNDFHDTVYVTANPHVNSIPNNTFHKIISDPLKNWDTELQCVPPEAVTEAAIAAHQDFPNKRIIVHYMQPHDPPLGTTADQIRERFDIGGPVSEQQERDGDRIMELVAHGEVDEDLAREAYRETLDIVISDVRHLLQEISGKVVISSDHGEMFGESPYRFLGKLYEHYNNPRTIELCKVPWFVIVDDSERRDITSEVPREQSREMDDLDIERQLEALGYK